MKTELDLVIEYRNGRSVLGKRYFTHPLSLGTPRSDGDRLSVVLMMASAGILKGDEFRYQIECKEASKCTITEQSYSKIFDTGEGQAEKQMEVIVGENASLYYRPSAVIPFAGSSFCGKFHAGLQESSEFLYTDIFAAGRIGMGEKFAFRRYQNRCSVEIQGKTVWMDACLYEPEQMELSNLIFFDRFTHLGTIYYYGSEEKQELLYQAAVQLLHQISARHGNHPPNMDDAESSSNPLERSEGNRILCAASHARQGICIRILGVSAQEIDETMEFMLAESGILEQKQ